MRETSSLRGIVTMTRNACNILRFIWSNWPVMPNHINQKTANEICRTAALGQLSKHSFDIVYLYVLADLSGLWSRFRGTSEGRKYAPVDDTWGSMAVTPTIITSTVSPQVFTRLQNQTCRPRPLETPWPPKARDFELNSTRKPPKPYVPFLTGKDLEAISTQLNEVGAKNSAALTRQQAAPVTLSITPNGTQLLMAQLTTAQTEERAASRAPKPAARVHKPARTLPPLPPVPHQIPAPNYPNRLPPIRIVGFASGKGCAQWLWGDTVSTKGAAHCAFAWSSKAEGCESGDLHQPLAHGGRSGARTPDLLGVSETL